MFNLSLCRWQFVLLPLWGLLQSLLEWCLSDDDDDDDHDDDDDDHDDDNDDDYVDVDVDGDDVGDGDDDDYYYYGDDCDCDYILLSPYIPGNIIPYATQPTFGNASDQMNGLSIHHQPTKRRRIKIIIGRVTHMAVCQNLVPLVNIKIAGIYGCSFP